MHDFRAILFNKMNQTFKKKIYWADFNRIYYDYWGLFQSGDIPMAGLKIMLSECNSEQHNKDLQYSNENS